MALLKFSDSPRHIYLKPVHIFGRDPNVADFVLDHQGCSRLHCVFRWQNGQWFVTDESKNGCFVNGKRIERGRSLKLNAGDTFSVTQNDQGHWTLASDNEPAPVLLKENASDYLELGPLNLLPDEQNPELQIIQQGDDWMLERDHESRAMREGDSIMMAGASWLFYPNYLLQDTEIFEQSDAALPVLQFEVSRAEEHVRLVFAVGDASFDLGHKTHHYLLLEMARHKLNDPGAGEAEAGWMSNDLLLHNLGIDISHLNIQIYRARGAIKECSSYWGQHLIERRRGEIRLHQCRIDIQESGA